MMTTKKFDPEIPIVRVTVTKIDPENQAEILIDRVTVTKVGGGRARFCRVPSSHRIAVYHTSCMYLT